MIKLELILKQYREVKDKYGEYSSLHEAYAVLKEEIDEIWDIVKQKPELRNHKELEKEILDCIVVLQKMYIDIVEEDNRR